MSYEAISLYREGIKTKLMYADDNVQGILRALVLDPFFPDVQEWDSNSDLGGQFYLLCLEDEYPGLVRRLKSPYVVVEIDSRNFLGWYSFETMSAARDAYEQTIAHLFPDYESDDQ